MQLFFLQTDFVRGPLRFLYLLRIWAARGAEDLYRHFLKPDNLNILLQAMVISLVDCLEIGFDFLWMVYKLYSCYVGVIILSHGQGL
jgi:hypothetical protein